MNSLLRRRYSLYVAPSSGTEAFETHQRHEEPHGGAVVSDEILQQQEVHIAPADLNNVRWVSHCRDLVQLPVAP
jgi:hypothetical protein